MGEGQALLKVGVVAITVALVFAFAAAAAIAALRGEPTPALASEPVDLVADETPVRPASPPQHLTAAPDYPEPERVRQQPEPPRPAAARSSQVRPEPRTRPQTEPARKTEAERAARPQTRPGPEPDPEPAPVRTTDRTPDRSVVETRTSLPPREASQRAERGARRGETQSRREAAPAAKEAVPAAEEAVPAAKGQRPEKPQRSVLPAGVTMSLSISALGLRDVPVRTSARERALDNGVIHLPDTSLPWDRAAGGRNVYLAGHRLGYPGTGSHRIFYKLGELRRDDEIVVKDRSGRRYEYRVAGSRVVAPGDSWVKDRVRGRDMLSLQTCTPIPSFEQRLIVRANRA